MISRLATWLQQEAGAPTKIRIGFLDPDDYAEGDAQVSSFDHRDWLRTLATGCSTALSAVFSGCQNPGQGNAKRNQRLVSFHSDELALYPGSLVFEYGNFQIGVKIRWPQDSCASIASQLRRRIKGAWHDWDQGLGPLTVHVDGKSGD